MRLILTAAVAFVAACSASVAAAGTTGSVQHDRYPLTSTFTDTSLCGFPIQITSSANFDDALFFDSSGNLVRLLETVRNSTLTFSANGTSLQGRSRGGCRGGARALSTAEGA